MCLIVFLGTSGLWWIKKNKNCLYADGIPILIYHTIGDPPNGAHKKYDGMVCIKRVKSKWNT